MQTSNITVIVLLGFPGVQQHFKNVFFFLIFIIYCLTILGNILIITLVFSSKNLQSPMYIFITQVSITDIFLSTDIIPNTFPVVLNEGGTISLQGCIAQFLFFANAEATECLLLAVMSYDRYLAICNPFHYSTIMTPLLCLKSIVFTWLLSFVMTLADAIAMCYLTFCRTNVIDHFFCDLTPLLGLACSDTSLVRILSGFFCFIVLICPFISIVVSYFYIVFTILRIPSITGRQKAFSTCSSHLTVVGLFYGALISVYVVPSQGHPFVINKIMSLSYTVMTPLLNPLVYSLRNKDFKDAFRKYWQHSKSM
ncbi:olfactory receptor 11L1-like [Hyperolius riggenbachi]|uniref:olfactory receptor 11L1-like n=1 Tax=Hyperolius riggenbachi TaxID=752182 RepID=UPI0035A261F0